MATIDTTACGTSVFVAIIVVSAPQRAQGRDGAPPEARQGPQLDAGDQPDTQDDEHDSGHDHANLACLHDPAPSHSVSNGRTTMARSVAPEAMEPVVSDTHTLSQAPQPTHLSAMTRGCGFAPPSDSSMASYPAFTHAS